MKTVKYYFGVYIDYPENIKIAQCCLEVDDLSCEMLADPGLITFYTFDRFDAKRQAKQLAIRHECKFIEFGWGKYQLIKVKKP